MASLDGAIGLAAPITPKRRYALTRSLTRADVIAVATGAMFSSGFFLLPGLAAAATGWSAILAYAFAAILVIPAMLCQAELMTAMPRAGGAYFFVDRSLGARAGTIGGVGAWATLVLKSAFALFGFGAYVALFVDASPRLIGAVGGIVFLAVNLVGAKESSQIQRFLVGTLVGLLAFFMLGGFTKLAPTGQLSMSLAGPFLSNGMSGLLATTAMVSVSYAGLTKVASIAEEVRDPDKNLPSGMFWSLGIATSLYVGGVWLVLATVDPATLHTDLAPVATAASALFDGILPGDTARMVIAVAALAAFLSTANAGIMAAARYPLAMARDGRVPDNFAKLSERNVPVVGVWVTGLATLAAVVALDVVSLAKLASAFQLLLFAVTAIGVIVMRESGITAYKPGFRTPYYPLFPLLSIAASLGLIISMGWKAVLFPSAVVIVALLIARSRPEGHRDPGAIAHIFRRWGASASKGLERELGSIVAERALEEGGNHAELVSHITLDGSGGWAGRTVRELALPHGALLVFIDRGVDAFVPDGDSLLEVGDRLTLVCEPGVEISLPSGSDSP